MIITKKLLNKHIKVLTISTSTAVTINENANPDVPPRRVTLLHKRARYLARINGRGPQDEEGACAGDGGVSNR